MPAPGPQLWEGWLAEHPDGGVMFLLDDDSRSPMLRSNEGVREFFTALSAEEPKTRRVVDMVRVRHCGEDVDEVLQKVLEDKVYPPPEGGA